MPSEPTAFFVDTNVFLYARDETNPEKRETALRWLEALSDLNAVVISPQVVNEYCNVLTTKIKNIDLATLRSLVLPMKRWRFGPTDFDTALRALDLKTLMHVRFYDAVLLASALAAGCTHFLSEDLQHDRLIGDMRVVNPFLVAPEAVIAVRGR